MKRSTSKTRLMELAGLREVDPIGDIRKSISVVKLTQQNWVKMTPEQQGNALLSVMDDTDEAESYIGAAWDELPSQATANMRIAIKKGTSMNEEGPSSANMNQSDDSHAFYTAVEALGELPGVQSATLIQALEDGYYALADNAPVVVTQLELALKALNSKMHRGKDGHLEILQKELKIYQDIRALLDSSVLGTVL